MNALSLVFRSALENKTFQIQELKYNMENLKNQFREELQKKGHEFAVEINAINAKNTKDLDEEKERYQQMQEEHEH